MKLTATVLKRPVAIVVVTIAVFFIGLFSVTQLDINYLPEISYPMVKIHIWWRGATPDDIETNIADPVEQVIATVDDLDYLESSSIEGMYTLLVNFQYGVNVEVAFQDVVAAMGRVTKDLPKDMDPPVIIKADPTQLPAIMVMLTSDRHSSTELRDWADIWLADRLATVPGTAGTEIVGGKKREIRVHLDPQRLQAYNLSTADVAKALYQENIETFAGRVTIEPREIIARIMGEFESLDEIKDVVVALGPSGEEVYIKDLAVVEDAHEEQRIITHFDGKPCVQVKVLKQYAANAVDVATALKERVKELHNDIPEGIAFHYFEDDSTYILGAISSVRDSALVAAVLVILVIYFFLGRWRQVLTMMIALPLTLLGNFLLMMAADFSLNVFSMGGMVVALGVILDNSIVVLENITRLKAEKVNEYALEGTREVGSAIVASTMTFLALFLPFVFVPGMVAILFKELVMVVGGVVAISLLVATTITPFIMDRLLRNEKVGEVSRVVKVFDRVIQRTINSYAFFLGGILKLRWLVLLTVPLLFGIAILLMSQIGSEFLPKLDDGRVMVKLKTPSGTSVTEMDRILEKAESLIRDLPEIANIFRLTGGREFGLYTLEIGNEGELDIQLVPKSQRTISTLEFVEKIRPIMSKLQASIPSAKLPVLPRPIKGIRKVGEQDIEVYVKGTDIVSIFEFSEELASHLSKTPGLSGVNVSMDMTRPEYRVYVDRSRASAMGISVEHVATTLRTLVQGMVGTQYRVGNDYYPIRVMVPEVKISSKPELEELIIDTQGGEPIYLRDIAEVRRAVGPVEISREDQVMRVIVRADTAGVSVGEGLALAEQIARELDPTSSGVEFSMGSQGRFMAESRRVMGLILGFAALFAYVILAIQFESFVLPLLIMLNVPFSLTGAFLALFITGSAIGVPVQIGVLIMMGGITSQGVVLLVLAEEYRQNGLSPREAIWKAAPMRVRPILMTQLTTVLGLLPLALNMGEGGDMLVAMAIAVIGGLLYSLLLTLVFLPSAYTIVIRHK